MVVMSHSCRVGGWKVVGCYRDVSVQCVVVVSAEKLPIFPSIVTASYLTPNESATKSCLIAM